GAAGAERGEFDAAVSGPVSCGRRHGSRDSRRLVYPRCMRRSAASARECARALWLLGLTPPVSGEQLTRAWRARVSRSHPDLHLASESRSAAATLMTTALNHARRTVSDWIESGRVWPR